MLRLLAMCLLLSGCLVYADGQGTSGNVSWSFTITNTLPPAAVIGGGGGLVVVITYAHGGTATRTVQPGETLVVPANGATVGIFGGGSTATAGPGESWYWTGSAWSRTPPAPSASG